MSMLPKEIVNQENKIKKVPTDYILWCIGLSFTFIIAVLGFVLSLVPGINHIGPMACAIVFAVVYRQIFGYPERIRLGIQFSSKKLLRFAIILYGLKLNMDIVLHQGVGLLLRDAGTVIFSILLTTWVAKKLKADPSLSLLLGIGTGVCGAAAIAAVSPLLKAKDEDTALGAGIIALVGTIFSITYTFLRPFLPLTNHNYGIWSGVSLHEIAHVALSASPAGQDALAIALLAKLGRVFLLVPLSFILIYWMKRSGKIKSEMKIEFPWFLIGFIIMSLIGSYILGKTIHIPSTIMNLSSDLTTLLLTMAMVGLGLNVNLREFHAKGFRPLIAMIITSVLLSIFTFFTLY